MLQLADSREEREISLPPGAEVCIDEIFRENGGKPTVGIEIQTDIELRQAGMGLKELASKLGLEEGLLTESKVFRVEAEGPAVDITDQRVQRSRSAFEA